MKNLEKLYGNGVVYVSDGEMVAELPGHNFDIESLEVPQGIEFWFTDGAVVSLGSDTDQARAVLALEADY